MKHSLLVLCVLALSTKVKASGNFLSLNAPPEITLSLKNTVENELAIARCEHEVSARQVRVPSEDVIENTTEDEPSQKVILSYFSDDPKINLEYYNVIKATLDSSKYTCLLVNSSKELKTLINENDGDLLFFNISKQESIVNSSHTSSNNVTTNDQYIITNFFLNLSYMSEDSKKIRVKTRPIMLKNNNLFKCNLDTLYHLHNISPQISPMHIGAFILDTLQESIYDLSSASRINRNLTFYMGDYYYNINKLKNDTLYFPEISILAYRPMSYGKVKSGKRFGRVNPYKFPKKSFKNNMDLTSIFLYKLKAKQPMYIYDFIRRNNFNFYIIREVVSGKVVYIDYDNFGYNQRKRFFRRMSKNISKS